MERKDALNRGTINGNPFFLCPNQGCAEKLWYTSGEYGIPEHIFCPKCVDRAYDPDTGEFIAYLY